MTRRCEHCGKVEHAATIATLTGPETVWHDGRENLMSSAWRAELEAFERMHP